MKFRSNSQLEQARAFLENTNVNIFLTGKAGTGKTTFLHNTLSALGKRYVVAAPTGIAALNARGVTLHSLFQLSFSIHLPGARVIESSSKRFNNKMSRNKRALIRSLELLVIDEISMVRSDLLDAVDKTMREVRRDSRPFGGVQLLMVGDIHQLSPICRDEEWQLLSEHYPTPYFFDSLALKSSGYVTIELTEIFRQKDREFTSLLNAVRENRITDEVVEALNRRYIPNFEPPTSKRYITLTTHVRMATKINTERLGKIKRPSHTFEAQIKDDFPEHAYPNDTKLELKVGAQVIFLKNDSSPEKIFYNGMIGEIASIEEDRVYVLPTDREEVIEVKEMEWENIEYIVNPESGEIEEHVKGSFSQLPIRCAWAITIHKSQGLSFDRAIIDASSSFAHGQVYVALSRCRTLEGMVLSSPLKIWSVINDRQVESFSQMVSRNQPDAAALELYKRRYMGEILRDIFSFDTLLNAINDITRLAASQMRQHCPELRITLLGFSGEAHKKLLEVGNSFIRQIEGILHNPEAVSDSFLHERLAKGGEYFDTQLEPLHEMIASLRRTKFDMGENKSRYYELLSEIIAALEIKKIALELCRSGFTMELYQKERLKIIAREQSNSPQKQATKITKEVKKKGERDDKKEVIVIENNKLYEQLVAWRLELSRSKKTPAYIILYNRTLIEIERELPLTDSDLLALDGIGQNKLELYGEAILEMVREYCLEQGLISKKELRKVIGDR